MDGVELHDSYRDLSRLASMTTHELEVVGVGLLDDFDQPHDARHLCVCVCM
jgi:hypothetical protein